MKGYFQIYTGDGKGKTTAALGLIVRAVGAGLRVYLGQFIKRGSYSEIRTLRRCFPEVTVRQFGRGCFIKDEPARADIAAAGKGLEELQRAMRSGRYDLVIADEANDAVSAGLFDEDALIALVHARPDAVELVVTGRNAGRRLIREADLVTEMKARKHYFRRGVNGRKGIES